MSFGWSAGDVAQAISFVVKIAKALDSANGAAADYREAVEFLRSLKRTLEPLQTFSGLELYPVYGEEIRQHVEKIRVPISKFLVAAAKYEPQLGSSAKSGRRRGFRKKLEWRFIVSKKLEQLRREIDNDLRIIDSLIHRLTLEMIIALNKTLSGDLKTAFTEVLDPRLVELLQLHLQPLSEHVREDWDVRTEQHQAIISNFDQYESILPALQIEGSEYAQATNRHLEAIIAQVQKQDLDLAEAVRNVKMHIEKATSFLKNDMVRQQSSGHSLYPRSAAQQRRDRFERAIDLLAQDSLGGVVRESLQELYYLAFLYLGHFLRDFFLALSLVVRPKPAPTPVLIAKYHISFYDAIGRSPRVLDYACFASYKVFQAFLEDSFAGRPGTSWVELGLYQLANARNGLTISSDTWSSMISPGSHVNMSMLVDQVPAQASKLKSSEEVCPTAACEGILQKTVGSVWMKCSKCEIEVLILKNRKSLPSSSKPNKFVIEQSAETTDIANEDVLEADGSGGAKIGASIPTRTVKDALVDDMVHFRRVLRYSQPPPTFLFAVNELSINEDPGDGGVAPRFNENRMWIPPIYRNGFGVQTPGALYRWTDGIITGADDCQFHAKSWSERETSTPLTLYDATSMFWAGNFTQFMSTPGDASTRDMANEEFSSASYRWWPLTFRHEETLSRIEITGGETFLAGSGSVTSWIKNLGLHAYISHRHETRAEGLAGRITMIIALVAFSCQFKDLEKILLVDRAWHLNKWRRHGRTDGHFSGEDQRGLVVNVYLDPENPEGSTPDTIWQLEWGQGALLK